MYLEQRRVNTTWGVVKILTRELWSPQPLPNVPDASGTFPPDTGN